MKVFGKIFNKSFLFLFSISFLVVFSFTAKPQLLSFQTKKINTIFLSGSQSYLIPHLASCFENTSAFQKKLYGFESKEQVSVLFNDFADYGNAGAINIPFNLLIVGIEPFDYAFDLMPSNERMNWLMNHELTHIVMCDQPNSTDRFWRSAFSGKVSSNAAQPLSMFYSFLSSPRRYAPRWYHEGIAVFMETWMAGGQGRALGGYDEMVFRSMVKDSSYFYNAVGIESEGTTVDFQVGMIAYLYGTRFVNYLAHQYGPEKLLKWYVRTDSSSTYFSSQFYDVYGVSLRSEWDKWIEFEKNFQKENLKTIKQFPVTEFKTLSSEPLGAFSKYFYDKDFNKIIAAVNYPGQLSQIASIDLVNGKAEKICDMPSPAMYFVASLAYDDSSKTLFYTTNNSQNWRSINCINLKTKEDNLLMKDCRIGDIAFNKKDKSLWGFLHNNGYSYLVRIAPPYKDYKIIYMFPYGQDMFDLDISPDGEKFAGIKVEISGRQKIVCGSINEAVLGSAKFEELHEFENNGAANFVFSADSKYLYGTSYLTGVSNVFKYSFDTKKMDILTNTESGLFRPVPFGSDSVMAILYSGKGFTPVMFKEKVLTDVNAVSYLGQKVFEKYPELEKWKMGSPADIDIDSLTTYSGEYNEISHMRLTSIYPIAEGYKDFPSYGLRLDMQDPIGISVLNFTASYSPNKLIPEKQRVHLGFYYRYWDWELGASLNKADFYDLFGPTKTSMAGYLFEVKLNKSLIYETPYKMDYTLHAAAYGDLEIVPDYQNVSASFDKLYTVDGNIKYSYMRKSLGGVDDEAGFAAQLFGKNNYVNKKNFPRIWTNINYGFLLPWNHSSIWMRGSAGKSFGDRFESFANFYFGGFGNNYVDYQDAKRFRSYYSFPGAELNSIGGTNFAKMTLEWDLPALRFKENGFLAFYATYARLVFFGSGLFTNFDDKNLLRKNYSFGSQLDIELALFTLLKSTVSIGYGFSVEKGMAPSKELMISLKIL